MSTLTFPVAGAALALWVLTLRAAHSRGRRDGLDLGYGHGSVDGHRNGEARGFTRGYSQACLDHVLAVPAEGDHFTGALLSGALHEPVGEEWAALLGRIQEHERAAKETAR